MVIKCLLRDMENNIFGVDLIKSFNALLQSLLIVVSIYLLVHHQSKLKQNYQHFKDLL